MAAILFMFIIFPCHCAVYMYKITILQKSLSQVPPNFHQISNWSYCWNVIESLFKWSCSIDCHAHIFFKIKNCLNDDLFISCDDRIGKMLHNICISAVAMSHRWATRGPWASCFKCRYQIELVFLRKATWWPKRHVHWQIKWFLKTLFGSLIHSPVSWR